MTPGTKHRLKLVVSASLITLWGVGSLAGWPVLEGVLPLALVFLLNSPAETADANESGLMGLMQPRLVPIFVLLFFGVFYFVAKHGFPKSGLEDVWRGWFVIPVWMALLAQLVLQSDPEPAGEARARDETSPSDA
ncbi:hypothetical protein M8R20_35780 [Pseudomonas sp. R2.Fl]|nr:hypothetical protein [Pseudomonas sp. R2.Fl]